MNTKTLVSIGVVIVLILAFAPAFYFYNKYQNVQKLLARNPLILEENKSDVLTKIAKLMDLPEDEDPTVATVSDVEKLKSQPFFAKAKNGDKVVIYNNAKKAILYDPVANKIIEVGPLMSQQSGTPSGTIADTTKKPESSSSAQPAQDGNKKLRVYLYNGTRTAGLTNTVEKKITEKEPDIQVVDKDTAEKRDYAKTLVIDLSGNNKEEAQSLADTLKADISTLPAGEAKPADSDILIIVGNDAK